MSKPWIKALFVIAGVYDIVAGGVLLFASPLVFRVMGSVSPDPGYIEFPALLVMLFGVMFLFIAASPVARREQIVYGMGLKLAYSGVVFWHQLTGSIAAFFVPLAWADFAFFVLFFLAWRALTPKAEAGAQ